MVRHAGVTLMTFVIIGVYGLLALNLKVFSPIEKAMGDYSFEDFYYQILATTGEQDTSRLVTIVDMTELKSRRDLARVIEDITALQPKVLGVDVTFQGLKPDTLGDQLLTQAVVKSRGVYSYMIVDRTDEAVHSFFMSNDSISEGFVNMPRQLYGGMKRNLSIGRQHDGEIRPSFVKMVADRYAGTETAPLEDGEIRINFTPTLFRVLNYDEVLNHPDLVRDRVVLLGAMKEEGDMHYTPQGKMAGVELLAYGVETLLKQNRIRVLPAWLLVPLTFVVVLLVVMFRAAYLGIAKLQHLVLRAVMSLGLAVGLVVFCVVALFVWVAFILFCQYNVSINLGYAIAATAFIPSAIDLYDTIMNTMTKK